MQAHAQRKQKGFSARHIKQYPVPLWLGKECDWVWLSVIECDWVWLFLVSWWLEKLFVWLELILHVWTLLCFYINRVSQSYAKRTSEAPKRGLANSLAGHTLLPAWRIVWKKWMFIGKKAENGTFVALYCAIFCTLENPWLPLPR